ncbi:hypothetical protein K3495_g4791 [Podosphaera aphanis]|nr:hypothetical protein K3495_g4791 [Podosphaera aphanis]
MAGKLESREDYLPRHGIRQTKTWYISRMGKIMQDSDSDYRTSVNLPQRSTSTNLDADGDTPISGIDGISTSKLAAIINAVNSHNSSKNKMDNSKPPAPWRTKEEFEMLRAAGKCTRCERKGHYFKKCPKFTWTQDLLP